MLIDSAEDLAKLKQSLGLSDDIIKQYLPKIAWRRRLKKSLRGEFDEKYPENVLTMFLMPGNAYFDKEILAERYRELMSFKPYQTFSNGQLTFLHPRVPGKRYMIGADPATGRTVFSEDTDYSAAVVIDMDTQQEMTCYRARVIPQDFAADLADMGEYYNFASIAVERTGDGGTVILTLGGDCKYPNIAKFKEWHRKKKTIIEVEGFPTNLRTRPIACNFVSRWINDMPEMIYDRVFVSEALSFVRDERGIPSGANGGHDDTVSARWIAHGMRMHQLGYWNPGAGVREGYVTGTRMEATA